MRSIHGRSTSGGNLGQGVGRVALAARPGTAQGRADRGFGHAAAEAMKPIPSGCFFLGRHFGNILGTPNALCHGGAAGGIWIARHAHNVTSSYRLSVLRSFASVCPAAGCVWVAARRGGGRACTGRDASHAVLAGARSARAPPPRALPAPGLLHAGSPAVWPLAGYANSSRLRREEP